MARFLRPFCVAVALTIAAAPAAPAQPATQGNAVRTDRHGQALPEGAVARLGVFRSGARMRMEGLAFSPDGKMLALSDSTGAVYLFKAGTLTQVHLLAGHRDSVENVAFSPDGKTLASASRDGTVRLWDVAGGRERFCFRRHTTAVREVLFAPDGRTVASAEDGGTIRLWDPATGKERQALLGNNHMEHAMLFLRGGKQLVSIQWKTLQVWDVAAGKELHQLRGHSGLVRALALSPDGRVLASGGYDHTIRLWDVAAGKELRRLDAGRETITALAFSPDGKALASSSDDGEPCLWDPKTGKALQRLSRPAGWTHSVVFAPDGKTLVEAAGRAVYGWDIATGGAVAAFKGIDLFSGHRAGVTDVAFFPDGRRLASVSAEAVCVWDATFGLCRGRFGDEANAMQVVSVAPDGRSVAAGGRGLWLWDAATGKLRGTWQFGDVEALAFAEHGRSLIAGDGTGAFARMATGGGQGVRVLTPGGDEGGSASVVAVSPVNQTPRRHRLPWHVLDRRTLSGGPFRGGRFRPVRVTYTPSGRLLGALDRVGNVWLWEAATDKVVLKLRGCRGCLAFAPDGRTLATAGQDGSVRLLEVTTGHELTRFHGHQGAVLSGAFSPDGRLLATGGEDSSVLVWRVPDQRPAPRAGGTLSAERLEALWKDLDSAAAALGYRAAWAFADDPARAVPFLRQRLGALRPREDPPVARLITDLDDRHFKVREQASRELARLGPRVEPALRRALANPPSPEVRRRLEQLLDRLDDPRAFVERRRPDRALEALEHIGTPAAARALASLARETHEPWLAEEAKAALGRIECWPVAGR
jgi:WD40 repeat protein